MIILPKIVRLDRCIREYKGVEGTEVEQQIELLIHKSKHFWSFRLDIFNQSLDQKFDSDVQASFL